MMTIEIRINGLFVASAQATSQSHLDPVSDYIFWADEMLHPVSGKNARVIDSAIKNHDRAESVWSLVEKIAAIAKED